MVIPSAFAGVIDALKQVQSIEDAGAIHVAIQELLVSLYAHYPDECMEGLKSSREDITIYPIIDYAKVEDFDFNFSAGWHLFFRRRFFVYDRMCLQDYSTGENNSAEVAVDRVWDQSLRILAWHSQGGALNRSSVKISVRLLFTWVIVYEYFRIRFMSGDYTDADGIGWRYDHYNLHSLCAPAVIGKHFEDYWIHGQKSFNHFKWFCDVEYFGNHPKELAKLKLANQLILLPSHLRPQKQLAKGLRRNNKEFEHWVWLERVENFGKIRK